MMSSNNASFSSKIQYDLVIVGGGIVGASLACLLAKRSENTLKIALIEAVSQPCETISDEFDPRVVALSRKSQYLLKEVDAWSEIENTRLCYYQKMHVWDGEGTGTIDFDCADAHEEQLGAIIENRVIVHALLNQVQSAKSIDTFFGLKVAEMNIPVTEGPEQGHSYVKLEDGTSLCASLIVAADGANSLLRELAGIETREWSYGHTAIVTTIATENTHEFTAWQRFDEAGPLAYLPLTKDGQESRHCSIVWSIKNERADGMMALSDHEFCEAVAKALEYKLGKVIHVDKRYAIPLKQRHGKHYVRKGFAIVGDAAHTIHPLAGQGVNLGFYDIDILANEILRAKKRELPLADFSILKRYERQRQAHNLVTMAAMEGFKQLFGSDNLALRWLRNDGMRFVNRRFMLKKHLTKLASGMC